MCFFSTSLLLLVMFPECLSLYYPAQGLIPNLLCHKIHKPRLSFSKLLFCGMILTLKIGTISAQCSYCLLCCCRIAIKLDVLQQHLLFHTAAAAAKALMSSFLSVSLCLVFLLHSTGVEDHPFPLYMISNA